MPKAINTVFKVSEITASKLVSAHRRDGMYRAPIYERDWRPSCIVRRSSSSSVASGAARTAMRVTTAVSSLLKLRLLVDEILTNSEDHYTRR